MATDTRNKNEHRADTPAAEPAADRARASRDDDRTDWSHRSSYSPFAIMRQGIDEMDRWWSRLSSGGGFSSHAPGRGGLAQFVQQFGDWSPAIEAFQRGSEFVIRAEVPGMNRQDLTIEAGDDSITIRGERKQERREDREGAFFTERSYGSFTRVIPLPPGAITDSAKATFTNGVLEIVLSAPSAEARRGRRIDISGHS